MLTGQPRTTRCSPTHYYGRHTPGLATQGPPPNGSSAALAEQYLQAFSGVGNTGAKRPTVHNVQQTSNIPVWTAEWLDIDTNAIVFLIFVLSITLLALAPQRGRLKSKRDAETAEDHPRGNAIRQRPSPADRLLLRLQMLALCHLECCSLGR